MAGRAYFAVDADALWPAVEHALVGQKVEPWSQLGANELLLATIVGLVKPEYIGRRYSPLEPGETWEEQEDVSWSLTKRAPVELLIHELAGKLRYAGTSRSSTYGLLERLGVPDPALVRVGTWLTERCHPPGLPSEETFPDELRILDKQRAPELREHVRAAVRRYHDSNEDEVLAIATHLVRDPTPDDGVDRELFNELAVLESVYDVLVETDQEILFATIV